MTDHHLFLAHQQAWDLVWDDVRLPPPDHPWLAVPLLRGALYAQVAVRWATAVRRVAAMRAAGWLL